MATSVFSVLLLCAVLGSSFSMTIPQADKTVDLSGSVRVAEEESTPAVRDPHLRHSEDSEFVLSLTLVDTLPSVESGERKHARRVKRHVFKTPKKCAGDMVEVPGRCLTPEQYKRLTGENEVE